MLEVYASHTSKVNASRTSFLAGRYLGRMERADSQARRDFGLRLKAARLNAGMTQEAAAGELHAKKATVSSWEIGNNLPDALTLGRLAKLYGVTADLLIWDRAVSMEAIAFAVQFDALDDRQRRAFKAMWLAYFQDAKSDEEVGRAIAGANEKLQRQQPRPIEDRSGDSAPPAPRSVKR
jgi:transcriptional regulator with XRE-family HTH domain